MLLRFEGEVVGPKTEGPCVSTAMGVDSRLKNKERIANGVGNAEVAPTYSEMVEEEVIVRDPRREPGFRKLNNLRPWRGELVEARYEYDPPHSLKAPPTAVLVTNIPPLTPTSALRGHYRSYGNVSSFEWQIDRSNGAALGVLFIRFATAAEAAKCVKGEEGRRVSFGLGLPPCTGDGDGDNRLKAVLDGDGKILAALMKGLEERRIKEREERRRKEKVATQNETGSSAVNGSVTSDKSQTPGPSQNQSSWNTKQLSQSTPSVHGDTGTPTLLRPAHPSLPMKPTRADDPSPHPVLQNAVSNRPTKAVPMRGREPPEVMTRARQQGLQAVPMAGEQDDGSTPQHEGGGSTPLHKSSRNGLGGCKSSYRSVPLKEKRHPSRSTSPPYSYRDRDRNSWRGRYGWDTWRSGDRSWSRSRSRSRSRSQSRDRSRERVRDRGRRYERSWDRERRRRSERSTDYRDRRRERERYRERDEQEKAAEKERHETIMDELAKNGRRYVTLPFVGSVQEEDVQSFFEDFSVEKIFKDHTGWYVSFLTVDAADRSALVLSNSRQLAYHSVQVTAHPAVSPRPSFPKKKVWKEEDLVEEAQQLIIRDLRTAFEKDIRRIAESEMLLLIMKEKEKIMQMGGESANHEKRGLKGLSFKKQPKKVAIVEEVPMEEEALEKEPQKSEENEEVDQRPKKKMKKLEKQADKAVDLEVESEDEDIPDGPSVLEKRMSSEERDEPRQEQEPLRKRRKVERLTVWNKAKGKTKKKVSKKGQEVVEDLDDMQYHSPSLDHSRLTPTSDLTQSSSPAPEAKRKTPRVVTPPPTPPPDPFNQGLCKDDEDLYYLKLAIEGYEPPDVGPVPSEGVDGSALRKHVTGSGRTEGFYKITHAEKAAYVSQYQARAATTTKTSIPLEEPQHITSSRSNRANARRRAQGLEEINQVQRAVALSKGENVNELTFKFNQLQTRKKHLRFARSAIHDWGLYAMEKISKGEMVIEYVGEIIRAQVAEKREKAYERQGIGSSYLFRIDEDLVVDATKKGNLGRLINHSCDPNCTAKIITINGEKKIVIYAKQDIELGQEITYDYHFPFEQDKIPCLCGSVKCRGFLN